jgi:hypothetical protein
LRESPDTDDELYVDEDGWPSVWLKPGSGKPLGRISGGGEDQITSGNGPGVDVQRQKQLVDESPVVYDEDLAWHGGMCPAWRRNGIVPR